MAKKGMKRPEYTGPEARNQSPAASQSRESEGKNKANPGQTR